ncbi:MAG: hypothetical protein ABI632_13780 [Pseudolysinimonas sp.]
MQKTYLFFARFISVLIVVQAMAIVITVAGLFHWIDGGATLDKSVVDGWDDNPPDFQGSIGGFIHFFLVGMVLIPLSGLILLIVSFFAKIPRGVAIAAAIVVSIIVQYASAVISSSAPYVGAIHGLNAFILLALTLVAAKAAKEARATQEAPAPAA